MSYCWGSVMVRDCKAAPETGSVIVTDHLTQDGRCMQQDKGPKHTDTSTDGWVDRKYQDMDRKVICKLITINQARPEPEEKCC